MNQFCRPIAENIQSNFQELGQYIAFGSKPIDSDYMGENTYNQIQVDLTTTFTILIGIFFPSVTGEQCFVHSLSVSCSFLIRFQKILSNFCDSLIRTLKPYRDHSLTYYFWRYSHYTKFDQWKRFIISNFSHFPKYNTQEMVNNPSLESPLFPPK